MAAITETMTVAPMGSVNPKLRPQPPASRSRRPPVVLVEARGSNRQKPKSTTTRLDPVRILEPARKKLSSLEAQRVMGALRDTVHRAEIVVSLPYILQHLDDHRNLFEDEFVEALENHRSLLTSIRPQALEEMFCEAENQSSARSESYNGDEKSELARLEDGEENEGPYEEETKSEQHSGEIRKRAGKGKWSGKFGDSSSEMDGRSGTGRLTDMDGVSSGWQSRSYRDSQMEEQRERDGRSEIGRQTMTTNKSSRGATDVYDHEEEEEEESEEWEEGDEPGSALEGAVYEPSLKRGDTEASQLFDRTSKSSVPLSSISLREWSRTRMEIPQQNVTMLAESCRNILRSFPVNQKPVLEVLKECEGNWKEKSSDMIQHLRELRGILLAMLLISPLEELEKSRYLRELLEKERYNSEIIAKLSAELNTAENEKSEAIGKLNDVIRKLQSNLHSNEKTSEENIRRMKLEAEKQEAADKKNTEGRLTKLQQDLTQVQAQYNNLKEEHREKELALRRRKFQVETEVENWIQKFDMDMGERQDEYERIDLVYTEEKRQLNELEEKFKRLETEYQQIQEERRIAREKRDIAERELQMCIRAATTIQAFWRSFKVRKAIKAKKKKKGVKKGKK